MNLGLTLASFQEYLIILRVHLQFIWYSNIKLSLGGNQQLYLHDRGLDLVSSVVHVERELCPDPAGVLNQSDSGAMRRHVQRVHDLEHRRGVRDNHRSTQGTCPLLVCFHFYLFSYITSCSQKQTPSSEMILVLNLCWEPLANLRLRLRDLFLFRFIL